MNGGDDDDNPQSKKARIFPTKIRHVSISQRRHKGRKVADTKLVPVGAIFHPQPTATNSNPSTISLPAVPAVPPILPLATSVTRPLQCPTSDFDVDQSSTFDHTEDDDRVDNLSDGEHQGPPSVMTGTSEFTGAPDGSDVLHRHDLAEVRITQVKSTRVRVSCNFDLMMPILTGRFSGHPSKIGNLTVKSIWRLCFAPTALDIARRKIHPVPIALPSLSLAQYCAVSTASVYRLYAVPALSYCIVELRSIGLR